MNDTITTAIRTGARNRLRRLGGALSGNSARPLVLPSIEVDASKLWLLVVVALALAARLFRIDHQPLWLDEAFTAQRIRMDLRGLMVDSLNSGHPPTYFLLLRLLSRLFAGEAWLRIPSAVFGGMSAGIVFVIASRLASYRAGIVAGLLMALSPLQVEYGQEARSYTLVTLLIVVALWGLLRLVEDPLRASIDVRRAEAERMGWGAYVLGTISALNVLGEAVPWLIASNLALLLIWRTLDSSSQARIEFGRNWLRSMVAIMACTLPFYVAIFVASNGHVLQKVNWIPPLSWEHVWVVTGSVYLMRMLAVVSFDLIHTAVPILGTMVALAAGAGIFRVRGKLEGRVLMLSMLVLPFFVLGVSLFKPLLLPRYVMWSAVPFFVLAGLGVDLLPRRMLAMAVTLLLLLGVVNLGPAYRLETKPRWDMAAATLTANVRPGDTVLTRDKFGSVLLKVLKPKGEPPLQTSAVVTAELDEALARWRQGSRVWAVNGRAGMQPRQDLSDFKDHMAALGSPAVEIPQGKEITILMFPAPDEAGPN